MRDIYLIDFENVASEGLSGITYLSPEDEVIIFYSNNSNRLSMKMHILIGKSVCKCNYFEVTVGGKNALDHQISTWLGYLIGTRAADRNYYIVSKDMGYKFVASFWTESAMHPSVRCIDNIRAASRLDRRRPARNEEETEAEVQEPVAFPTLSVQPEPVAQAPVAAVITPVESTPVPAAITPEPVAEAKPVEETRAVEAPKPVEEQAWASVEPESVVAYEEPEPESVVAPESELVAPESEPVVSSNPAVIPITPVVQAIPPKLEPAAAPAQKPEQPPAQTGNLWLVRLSTGERHLLPLGQQVKVGRGSACEIRLLNNRMLSRVHVALTSTGQMVMVTDLGAVNGVYVNGQRVGSMQSVLLMPGQHLRLADEEFDVRIG